MGVQWEIEYPNLRLDGNQIAWNVKNVGDETAASGTEIGSVTITRRADDRSPTPASTFTNPIALDRDVADGTSHALTYPVTWAGQEAGIYTVSVTFGQATAELYYRVDVYGNADLDNY